MKSQLILLIALLYCSLAYANSSSELTNENLLQDLPFPSGEWSVSQGMVKGSNMSETRWLSSSSDDMVQTFVRYKKPNGDVKKSKLIDNAIGRENCDQIFKSEIISDITENGYSQLTWYTVCQTSSGFYSKAIHKSIAGNDSMYEFKRIFRTEPTLPEWRLWVNYTTTVKVCDSRLLNQDCPKNLEQFSNSD